MKYKVTFKNMSKTIEIEKTTTTSSGTSTITTEERTKGSITDDAGLTFTMASDEVNIIHHLVSVQQLFIFTFVVTTFRPRYYIFYLY